MAIETAKRPERCLQSVQPRRGGRCLIAGRIRIAEGNAAQTRRLHFAKVLLSDTAARAKQTNTPDCFCAEGAVRKPDVGAARQRKTVGPAWGRSAYPWWTSYLFPPPGVTNSHAAGMLDVSERIVKGGSSARAVGADQRVETVRQGTVGEGLPPAKVAWFDGSCRRSSPYCVRT